MRKPAMVNIRKVNGVFTIDGQSVALAEQILVELVSPFL
jgi:hypothetical protein